MGEQQLSSVVEIVGAIERARFALSGGWADSTEHWQRELLEDLDGARLSVAALGELRGAIDALDSHGLSSVPERRAAFTVVALEREQQVARGYSPAGRADRLESILVVLGDAVATSSALDRGDELVDRDLLLVVTALAALAVEWVEDVVRRGAIDEAASQLRAPVCAYCGLGFVGEPEVEDLEVGGGYAHRACLPAVRS